MKHHRAASSRRRFLAAPITVSHCQIEFPWTPHEFRVHRIQLPRSNSPARKRPVPGNSGDFVEAVLRPENFRIFSNDFRPVPVGKHRKLIETYRKKSEKFTARILLPCSNDFRCFPAGCVDFPASFLQDPAGSSGRNHRPG